MTLSLQARTGVILKEIEIYTMSIWTLLMVGFKLTGCNMQFECHFHWSKYEKQHITF